MGTADVVPGVSGATVAVVLGIYEQLLTSVGAVSTALVWLARGDLRVVRQRIRVVDWLLVLPLTSGIGLAIISLAPLIKTQLVDHPTEVAGLFCGLVAAAIAVACRMFEWHHVRWLALATVVAAASFVLLGFQATPVAHPSTLAFFGAGAVAVCAMILPGISGSFVLLMLGMYAAAINMVDERMLGDAAAFVFGAGTGLALFSALLGRLIQRARAAVMAVLVGLMVGSLRVLWPWPNGVGTVSHHSGEAVSGTTLAWPSANEWHAPTLAAVTGFTVVMLLNRLSKSSNTQPSATDEHD